jgi:hypothetical protein
VGLVAVATGLAASIGLVQQHLLRGKETRVALKQAGIGEGLAAAAAVLLEQISLLMPGLMAALATLLLYLEAHMLAAAAAAV